ncbi:MAG: helix-turn-helix transcriptional regulator [Mesorhizobium sp.]|nr:MAG: helix-turn-helix transcriptional regulator [Mesorhizobium sp.]TKD34407.1 MAG: helix-turn-helix transcriptional regulator [Mesorhizobium sp.]
MPLRDLAKAAGVHRNSISNFETGKFGGSLEALDCVRLALEAAGVEFIPENGGGAGVRLRKA